MKGIVIHHGADAFHRGINVPQSLSFARGKFGRLFPTLPAYQASQEALLALGQPGGVMDPNGTERPDNEDIPAGFVFLGQFIDHDITLDTTSSLERQNDPEAIENFRTPALELDNVYGSGPDVTPYLYRETADHLPEMLLDEGYSNDLPRNSEGTALIGDPRNDENIPIAQLQLAFLKFHNAVLRRVRDFSEAQRIVRWHYQWLVLHKFLPATVGENLVYDVYRVGSYESGRRYYNWRNEPFIPVEFAAAAYRFGHAQVPGKMKVNDEFRANGDYRVPIFDFEALGEDDPDDLSGGHRAPRRYVDWKYFFPLGNGTAHQASKRITPKLSGPLFRLPFFNRPGEIRSLAQRNLLRGQAFGLPSGQAVARAMCEEPLATADLDEVKRLWYTDHTGQEVEIETGFEVETPLWYYILKEAEVCAGGRRLGPVGGRIVAEVLIGLLEGDRLSFLRADPCWKPTLGRRYNEFDMFDMLHIAGVV